MTTVSEALARAAQRDPDLSPYYALYRALFEVQEKARKEITATLELADPAALQARTFQGLPLISFAQLPIQADRFAGLAAVIAQELEAGGWKPEGEASALPADAGGWLALAQARFDTAQNDQAVVTLAEVAADMALAPYLAWAAEQVLPHLTPEEWKHGHCPVCGGRPDLAFLDGEAGARRLACSRCNSQWRYARIGCPFCGQADPEQIAYYPSDDGVYRLYVCQACRRYLKTKDLRKAGGPARVQVERITTVAMDAAARQAGYR
jgi:formate dehydrogenase maturation protein FdhE